MYKILIIEDETDIRKLISKSLENKGFETALAGDGIEGLKIIKEVEIDLVISDVMMPRLDGFNFLQELRKNNNVPVIFLSARGDEMDKILGLGLGADDYLVKPINMSELVARVEAHLRRNRIYDQLHKVENNIIRAGDIIINCDTYNVEISGENVILTAKEFGILLMFINNQQKVFTKKQIYNAVWEDEYCYDDNTIVVTISRLRSKIEIGDKKYFTTIRGIGYKFVAEK